MSKNTDTNTAAKIAQQTVGFAQLTGGFLHPVKASRKQTLETILTEVLHHEAAKHQPETGLHLASLSSRSQEQLALKLYNALTSAKIGEEALFTYKGQGKKSINVDALTTLKNASLSERTTLLTAGHIYDFADEIKQQLTSASKASAVSASPKSPKFQIDIEERKESIAPLTKLYSDTTPTKSISPKALRETPQSVGASR